MSRPSWSTPGQAVLLVCRGATARVAVPVAVAVGIVLSAVNEGSVVGEGRADVTTWVRVAVNFLVPYLVASIGYLMPLRAPSERGRA